MTDTAAPIVEDDEGEGAFTEIRDAVFTNLDAVGAAANGTQWFFAKSAGSGLVPAELVRELLGEDGAQATAPSNVVGPAAQIHGASVRKSEPEDPDDVAKAKLSSAELNDLPDSAFAYIEPGGTKDDGGKTTPRKLRHFAIHDKAHADDAAARIAQGAEFGDKAKGKVEAAQRKFGEDVSKADDSPKAEPMAKADDTETAAGDTPDLDVTTVMAEPDAGAGGSPEVPGSPVWEATDAATARKWSAILARAKVALETLSDREAIEAASADPSDIGASWDLSDAACAIDYALGILAPFAIGEQLEAECADEMSAVGKALADMDPDAPDTIAFLAVHAASGALSEPNATAMREAATALRKAVTALPREPAAKPEPEPEVAKAEKTAVPVYDAHGVLVGVCDPGDITPVTQVAHETTGDEMTEPEAAKPEGASTTTDAALIPGTQTVASPPKAEDDDEKVQKAVQAALTPLAEAVAELAKQVSQGADVAGTVDVLKERVEQLAKMPDDRNPPLLNGATGTAGVASRDGAVEDPYAELTKAVETATTPAERMDAQHQLAYAKVRNRFQRD